METQIDVDRDLFELNVFGPLALCRLLMPRIVEAKGTVAVVSSVTGHVAVPLSGSYNASKHALHVRTRDSVQFVNEALGLLQYVAE